MGMADWEVKYELGRDVRRANERIAELEKALRDVRVELESYSGLRTDYQDWTDAFDVIDKALGL